MNIPSPSQTSFPTEVIQLPEPSIDEPLLQLDFIFQRVALVTPKSRTKILTALGFYKRYLAQTSNYDPELAHKQLFYIAEQWDSFALIKVQSYLRTTNTEGNLTRLTSGTITNLVGALRKVMRYANKHHLTSAGDMLCTPSPAVYRETARATAYTIEEQEVINQWLSTQLERAYAVIQSKGYQRTGVGRDPRLLRSQQNQSLPQPRTRFGWYNEANLRWYFENIMQCQADYRAVPASDHPHYLFYYHAARRPGGYKRLFKSWQIKPLIILDVMMPLAMKLCAVTGLNPDSLWSLTVDCFQEKHPLTGLAYLQYFKGRSRGNMELHLSLYAKDVVIREFKEAQARMIRETIAMIRQASSLIRDQASLENQKRLFLYQCSCSTKIGSVQHIHNDIASKWCRAQVIASNLHVGTRKRLVLSMIRFRPTLITEMVNEGIDIPEIQDFCGHKSLITTLDYLDKNHLSNEAHNAIATSLQVIHDNQVWERMSQPVYLQPSQREANAVLFKGVLADCRNVFDPPEEVKRQKEYQPAQACTRHNMCLFCKNVVVMRHHLPTLIVYQRQIQHALNLNPTGLPNTHYYRRTLTLLNSILDPALSEFSQEEIVHAQSVAEYMDEFIDPAVYHPAL